MKFGGRSGIFFDEYSVFGLKLVRTSLIFFKYFLFEDQGFPMILCSVFRIHGRFYLRMKYMYNEPCKCRSMKDCNGSIRCTKRIKTLLTLTPHPPHPYPTDKSRTTSRCQTFSHESGFLHWKK